MSLTKLITARVTADMEKKIKAEVKVRKAIGHNVNQADIVRESLVEHFAKKPATQPSQYAEASEAAK